MLKKTILVFGAALAGLIPVGSSAQQKVMVDKVVAVVGNSGILYSEVYDLSQEIVRMGKQAGYTGERNPMSQALELMMEQKLLYQQALVDSVMIDNSSIATRVDEQVRDMIEQAGGSITQLEKRYNQPIFDIKRDLTAQLEESSYAQQMRAVIQSKVSVTPGEVDKYYKNLPAEKLPVVPEQYVFAQITKYPTSMQDAKLRARERLLSLKERVQSGEATFELMARMYSQDTESALRGGEIEPMPKRYFDPVVANAIENLRPGQLSDVVESKFGYELLQMIGKQDGNFRIRRILIRPEYGTEELTQVGNTLDSIANLIRHDSLSFAKAAQTYSDDKYSKMNGGIVSNLERLERYDYPANYATIRHRTEDLLVADYYTLRNLKPGEVSDSFASQDYSDQPLRKIVKLIEIVPAHPADLKNDYREMEGETLNAKYDIEFKNWLNKKVGAMYVKIDPDFRFDDFENKIWLK